MSDVILKEILQFLEESGEEVTPANLKLMTKFINNHEANNSYSEFNVTINAGAIPAARPRIGKIGFYDPNAADKKKFLNVLLDQLGWSKDEKKYLHRVLKSIGRRGLDPDLKKEYETFLSTKSLFKGMGHLTLHFYIPYPLGLSNYKRQLAIAGYIRPEKRPDIDNYAKFVMDAINHIFYYDDGQIVTANLELFYCHSGDERVDLSLTYRKNPLF